ncbi:MAG: hypothetical protein JW769_01125 [Parachlamydiales bacterium]|nr:hypothetical protein [Parachlamydiales bacterium]
MEKITNSPVTSHPPIETAKASLSQGDKVKLSIMYLMMLAEKNTLKTNEEQQKMSDKKREEAVLLAELKSTLQGADGNIAQMQTILDNVRQQFGGILTSEGLDQIAQISNQVQTMQNLENKVNDDQKWSQILQQDQEKYKSDMQDLSNYQKQFWEDVFTLHWGKAHQVDKHIQSIAHDLSRIQSDIKNHQGASDNLKKESTVLDGIKDNLASNLDVASGKLSAAASTQDSLEKTLLNQAMNIAQLQG